MTIRNKFQVLQEQLKALPGLAVAFSAGVDSTFLLQAAYEVLGDRVLAVTARSPLHPEREYREALAFVQKNGIPHRVIVSEELANEKFTENPPHRCYYCKRGLFAQIWETARICGIEHVADGSNLDDLQDYRPGRKALIELGVKSPLCEAGLAKDEIRVLSREMGLSTWDKPALACLATRFPYGERITREKLAIVDKAEQYLKDLGFKQVRVRRHGDTARIEVAPGERGKFFDCALLDRVEAKFKEFGFTYTALDLKGYRSGSMNESAGINCDNNRL